MSFIKIQKIKKGLNQKFNASLSYVCFGFMLSYCAHTAKPSQEPIVLSSEELSFFRPCSESREATFNVEVHSKDNSISTFDLDWVGTQTNLTRIEAIDSFGVSFLSGKISSEDIKISGRLGTFQLNKDKKTGYLNIKGTTLALQPEELRCLGSLSYPETWIEAIQSKEITKTESQHLTQYAITQPGRTINISFLKDSPNSQIKKACSTISWRKWFGLLGEQINWCYNTDKDMQGSFEWESYFSTTWKT